LNGGSEVMIWEAKGNKVFCGLCEQFSVVHEVIGGVPVFCDKVGCCLADAARPLRAARECTILGHELTDQNTVVYDFNCYVIQSAANLQRCE
jgi:hypothetical protein